MATRTLSENAAGFSGGGFTNAITGTTTVVNSIISKNEANSMVANNVANAFGGGMYNMGTLTLTNSLIADNAAEFGGGINNKSTGDLTITNCTITANVATNGGGPGVNNLDGKLTINNSVVARNIRIDMFGDSIYDDIFSYDEGSTTTGTNNFFGVMTGMGKSPIVSQQIGTDKYGNAIFGKDDPTNKIRNIMGGLGIGKDANPFFVDWENGDYRLVKGSSAIDAIDAGDISNIGISVDLDSGSRLVGRGATERTRPKCPCSEECGGRRATSSPILQAI